MKVRIKNHISSYRTLKNLEPGQIVDVPSEWADQLVRANLAEKAWAAPIEEANQPTIMNFLEAGGEGTRKNEEVGLPQGGTSTLPPSEISKLTVYDKLKELAEGNELIMIFGEAGSCKSRFVHYLTIEAERAGHKVLYVDAEGSLPGYMTRELRHYERCPEMNLARLIDRIERARKENLDGLVIDSVGLPGLVQFITLPMKQRLEANLQLARLLQLCYAFAQEKKGLAIVTNQPLSEFSHVSVGDLPPRVEPGEILPPWGGKAALFVPKLILRTEVVQHNGATKVALKTYKSRDLAFGKQIAEFVIDDRGVSVRWEI